MPTYPSHELMELYINLPKDLQDAIFSKDNAEKVYGVCTRNGIKDDNIITEIAKYTCYVLVGALLPTEFQPTLQKELKLEEATAKQIVWEISRFVFLPVKDSLEALYKIAIESMIQPKEVIFGEVGAIPTTEKIKPEKPQKKDVYRELPE